MSNLILGAPQTTMDDVPQQMALTPTTTMSGYGAEAASAVGHLALQATQTLVPKEIQKALTFAPEGGGVPVSRTIDSETANELYGVPGVLRWNKPVDEGDAQWASIQAKENLVRQDILTKTEANRNPLMDMGAQIGGGLLDPMGLTIMAASEGLGEGALSRLGWAKADATGILTAGRVANLARIPAAGLIENAPYVGISGALTSASGEDYTATDALRDLAFGAIVHTAMHPLREAFQGKEPKTTDPASEAPASALDPSVPEIGPLTPDMTGGEVGVPRPAPQPPTTDFVPPAGVPDEVDQMPAPGRLAAWMLAADQASRGQDVDVQGLIDKEREIPQPKPLGQEPAPDVTMSSWRPTPEPATNAVSDEGRMTPVQYGLVEMRDLTTSHHDDLTVNPQFPPELQPREPWAAPAGRAFGERLNAAQMMDEVSAQSGAPIISPSGVVESGNGAVIALRRASPDVARSYRAALEARGLDTTGMENPVRVRLRTQMLTDPERSALVHEWSGAVTAAQQAAGDAARLDHAGLSLLDGTAAGRRAFAEHFLRNVAPEDAGELADENGKLTPAGEARLEAAILAKAYGEDGLVASLFGDRKSNLKSIGDALREAAPAWAKMRAAVTERLASPRLDLTEAVRSAAGFVRAARDAGDKAGGLIGELLTQREAFSDESWLSPQTEAVLRLMFREAKEGTSPGAAFDKPRAAAKIAQVLKAYAEGVEREGREAVAGGTPSASAGEDYLTELTRRVADGDTENLATLRPAGRTLADVSADSRGGPEANEPRPPVIRPGEGGEGGQEPGRPGAGEAGAAGEGEGRGAEPERAAGAAEPVEGEGQEGTEGAPTGDQVIAADPELAKLDTDTSNAAAGQGIEPEVEAADKPNTIAKAIEAAASCLIDAAGEVFG